MIDGLGDIHRDYKEAALAVNIALDNLINPHERDRNVGLASAYSTAMASYDEQSRLLEAVLRTLAPDPGSSDSAIHVAQIEDALAAAALVDGCLATRSLLVGLFGDEETGGRFQGVSIQDMRDKFGRTYATAIEPIRAVGVSVELIDAVGTGIWPVNMREEALLPTLNGSPARNIDALRIRQFTWEPFGLVLGRAADNLTETAEEVTFAIVTDNLAVAAGWLGDGLKPVFRTLRGAGLHVISFICVDGARRCFRRLLSKLSAGGRILFDPVCQMLYKVKDRVHSSFKNAFEDLLMVDRKATLVETRFPTSGTLSPDLTRMMDVANTKDRRKWQVTHGLASLAIPMAVSIVTPVSGPLGGVPTALILFVALAGVDTVLLSRVLPEIVAAAG